MGKAVKKIKYITEEVDRYGLNIRELAARYKEFPDASLDIELYSSYGCESCDVRVLYERMETDEEFEARLEEYKANIKLTKEKAERSQEARRALYESLKKEFAEVISCQN